MTINVGTIFHRGTGMAHGKAMEAGLWTCQLILAGIFAMAGFGKLTLPVEELGRMMPWSLDLPVELVRFIGISELAGSVGVLLPALFRVLPVLTPLAALGLTTIMILASLFHLSRGEYSSIIVTVVVGAIAAFVAWGRHFVSPIESKP